MSLKISNRLMAFPKAGKWLVVGLCIAGVTVGIWGYRLYNDVFQENVKKTGMFFIPTGSDFQQVVDSLNHGNYLKNRSSFQWVASRKKYPEKVQPGAYMIKSGWSNNQLINMLRAGIQIPVKVTFNNIRFREDLAARLASYLEPDSAAFLSALNNDKIASGYGFTHETFPMLIIPNTYEFYWDTSPVKFVERMKWEYDHFWNTARKKKAADLEMTPLQVVTIASILQEETNKNDEKSRMAGVYINRVKRGWLLQADPTIKYAIGNFQIKRVLTEYLSVDSPYNTYKHAGLPPGPINFPDIASVDAVLNAEHHNYMYFCAKEDFSGYHNFAQSLAEHNRNAARYQNELNESKIWK
ncbi:MAG: endolytic transglycosylase MltG [Bacteroidia bacterium]|nr:endolytic transglycosylase MltG [Bacteroidia bacterium]